MDVTPEIDKTELFSPPLTNTPLRICTGTSSKGLLTPCRQVGLRRRSLKSVTSPAITKNEITIPVSSSRFTVNETTSILPPAKKRCSLEQKATIASKQYCQVNDESNKKEDKSEMGLHSKLNEKGVHTNNAQSEGCSQSEISNFSSLIAEDKSTCKRELTESSSMVTNNECKFSITPKRPSLKKRYTPQRKRALNSYQNCHMVDEHNIDENKNRSDREKMVHSSNHSKDIQRSFTSKIVADDFSHVVKTVPFFGEIKKGEDPTDKIRIMRQYVKEKEEQLRLLKLAQLYRKKHDPDKLAASINKWKEICKAALYRLQEILTSRGQPMNMAQLLAQFGIPHEVLKFNPETDDFE